MRRLLAAAALLLAGAMGAGAGMAETTDYRLVAYTDLHGWAQDNHDAALGVFRTTCDRLRGADWGAICALAAAVPEGGARAFFEHLFQPVIVNPQESALFTGYFEPELEGALAADARFRYPIYARPPGLPSSGSWHTRAEIEAGLLAGQGLELAWLENPVDVFFLQVQGSGRIRLSDGSVLRLGFAAGNGHDYRSVGQEMVRRGLYPAHKVSAQVIRSYVQRNPEEGRALLQHNPSYVFFRRLEDADPTHGPIGAMGRPVTAMRSIAVDPEFTPLGAPVWIEKRGRRPLSGLMVAQDTGSAIKGAQRADIFYGTGAEAGARAGQVRDRGRMVVLLPVEMAHRLAPGG